MKYCILLLILSYPFMAFAAAETYSCRDKDGQLHVADTLMALPEECRFNADTSEPNAPGKVNYVPNAVKTQSDNNELQRALHQDQQQLQQRKRHEESLIRRAESLAVSFEQAVIARKSALRNKKYGFREKVLIADQTIQRARIDKKKLLEELRQSRLSSAQRTQAESSLDRIKD